MRFLPRFIFVVAAVINVAAPAISAPILELPLDQPVAVLIKGKPARLQLTTAEPDSIILNESSARRLGMRTGLFSERGAFADGDAVWQMGRIISGGMVKIADQAIYRDIMASLGDALPDDGRIGPFGLPQATVRLVLREGTAPEQALPLLGDINSGAYGAVQSGRLAFALGVDAQHRHDLPIATHTTGADLAAALGGRLVGDVWQAEIAPGVQARVQRLQFAQPLMIGALRFDAVAVRLDQPANQASLPADPRVPVRPAVLAGSGRSLMLSRTQLDQQGCTSLTIAKKERLFTLACAGPASA